MVVTDIHLDLRGDAGDAVQGSELNTYKIDCYCLTVGSG